MGERSEPPLSVDLEQTLKSKHSGNVTLIHTKLPLLLFADDLVLLADNHTGLQKSLDILAEYCQKWHIQVNFVKTKVLVFSRSRSPGPQNYTFAINQSIVETTNEYIQVFGSVTMPKWNL